MRIAQLANFYSPTSGGLRVVADQLRTGYRSAGHVPTLIVPGPRNRVRDDVVEIRSPVLPNRSGYRVIVSHRAVLAALEYVQPDTIEVHDKLLQRWVWRWAAECGIPVVAVSHERLDGTLAQFLPRSPIRLRAALAQRVAQRVLAEADRVVACSSFAASEFGGSEKLRMVPLGVDLGRFHPACTTVRTDGALRLISVGRLSAEKRPDIAVGALAELIRRGVRAELTLIGSGPWEKRLRRRAAHLPVRFVGHEPDADAVAAQLACSDIALSPGPAETFGLATLEGLACGTAAVVVAGAATSETIGGDDHAGRAVSLHPVAFADAILSLLKIPAQIRRAAATAAAENYRWSRTVAAMIEIHGELSGTDRLVAVGEDTA